MKDWQQITSKIVYKNPWIVVREDKIIHPSGDKGMYGVVEVPSGIFIIALNSKEEVLLVKQKRYPTGMESWELPGGGLKSDRTIEEQAAEELLEEGLVKAERFESLGSTQTQPGISTEIDHFLLALDVKLVQNGIHQHYEGINDVKYFPLKDVFEMILEGEITHGQSITGLMLYALRYKENFN